MILMNLTTCRFVVAAVTDGYRLVALLIVALAIPFAAEPVACFQYQAFLPLQEQHVPVFPAKTFVRVPAFQSVKVCLFQQEPALRQKVSHARVHFVQLPGAAGYFFLKHHCYSYCQND